MPSDLLSHRSGDFGSPRFLGRVRTSTPVCIDAIGETWAGYIAEGAEKGRMVLVTVCSAGAEDVAGRQILALSQKAIQVRHPNVLAFLDVARDGDTFALVSEYLDGEPLSTLLSAADAQSVPIPQGVALSIVKESIDALISLRRKKPESFPFGGLSPDVIFVASFGEAMLRNPGIEARAMTVPECRKHPSAMPYRAPEQMTSPMRLLETVDVFSAGVILWELLAGRPLFGGKSHLRLGRLKALPPDQLREIEHRVMTMKAPSLSTIQRPGGALHKEVIQLVESILKTDPSDRPPTLEALSRHMASLPNGLIASPVEIAATIEKLAGRAIQTRQRALRDDARVPVFGSKPPSNRVTSAPEEGDRATVEIPTGRDVAHLGTLLEPVDAPPSPTLGAAHKGLLNQGRETSPIRRAPEEDPFDVRTTTPQHGRRNPEQGRAIQSPEVAPVSSLSPLAGPARDDDQTTHTSAAHPITTGGESSSKGSLWVAASLVVLVGGGGLALSMFSQGRAASESAADTNREQLRSEDPASAEAEFELSPAELPSDEEREEGAQKPSDKNDPAETNEPRAEEAPDPATQAPRAPRPGPRAPPPAKKRPKDSSGAFRPMGI